MQGAVSSCDTGGDTAGHQQWPLEQPRLSLGQMGTAVCVDVGVWDVRDAVDFTATVPSTPELSTFMQMSVNVTNTVTLQAGPKCLVQKRAAVKQGSGEHIGGGEKE